MSQDTNEPGWTAPEHRWTLNVMAADCGTLPEVMREAALWVAETLGYDGDFAWEIAAFGPDAAGGELLAEYGHDPALMEDA